jgi:hypothetical protein
MERTRAAYVTFEPCARSDWHTHHMTIQRMNNVGIVVDDLKAAIAFFVELGTSESTSQWCGPRTATADLS